MIDLALRERVLQRPVSLWQKPTQLRFLNITEFQPSMWTVRCDCHCASLKIEDLLGAGAVLHHIYLPCSPEAQLARDAYRAARKASVSGRDLVDGSFPDDVELALE